MSRVFSKTWARESNSSQSLDLRRIGKQAMKESENLAKIFSPERRLVKERWAPNVWSGCLAGRQPCRSGTWPLWPLWRLSASQVLAGWIKTITQKSDEKTTRESAKTTNMKDQSRQTTPDNEVVKRAERFYENHTRAYDEFYVWGQFQSTLRNTYFKLLYKNPTKSVRKGRNSKEEKTRNEYICHKERLSIFE